MSVSKAIGPRLSLSSKKGGAPVLLEQENDFFASVLVFTDGGQEQTRHLAHLEVVTRRSLPQPCAQSAKPHTTHAHTHTPHTAHRTQHTPHTHPGADVEGVKVFLPLTSVVLGGGGIVVVLLLRGVLGRGDDLAHVDVQLLPAEHGQERVDVLHVALLARVQKEEVQLRRRRLLGLSASAARTFDTATAAAASSLYERSLDLARPQRRAMLPLPVCVCVCGVRVRVRLVCAVCVVSIGVATYEEASEETVTSRSLAEGPRCWSCWRWPMEWYFCSMSLSDLSLGRDVHRRLGTSSPAALKSSAAAADEDDEEGGEEEEEEGVCPRGDAGGVLSLEDEDVDEDEEGAGVDEVAGWAGGRVDARGERGPPPCVGASPHRRLPMSFNFTDHQSIDGLAPLASGSLQYCLGLRCEPPKINNSYFSNWRGNKYTKIINNVVNDI